MHRDGHRTVCRARPPSAPVGNDPSSATADHRRDQRPDQPGGVRERSTGARRQRCVASVHSHDRRAGVGHAPVTPRWLM